MTGAEILLLINIVITALFGAGFVAIALITDRRRVFWIAGAYGVGAFAPLSEFLLPLTPASAFFAFTSYATFLGGPTLISIGLAALHDRPPPWKAYWAILGGGIALRLAIWSLDRNGFLYQYAYQLPLALGALLTSLTVQRLGERRPVYRAVAALFALIAVQFLVKPIFAVTLGSGQTAEQYTHSFYAVISQASTAVLLVSAGLLVLMLVIQKTLGEARTESETDPLSGLANRRGFDRKAQVLVTGAERDEFALSAVLFDLDHFKAINDTYGHDVGDAVIAAFGALLRKRAPSRAAVGRTGGEEFAIVLPFADRRTAQEMAEAIREALQEGAGGPLPPVTASGGVAQWEPGESLVDLMRRADEAAYRAKTSGRNRICCHRGTRPGPIGIVAA